LFTGVQLELVPYSVVLAPRSLTTTSNCAGAPLAPTTSGEFFIPPRAAGNSKGNVGLAGRPERVARLCYRVLLLLLGCI